MCRIKGLQEVEPAPNLDSWFQNVAFSMDLQDFPKFDMPEFLVESPVSSFNSLPTRESLSPVTSTEKPVKRKADDELLLKRQKQNAAAKKCRLKKQSMLQSSLGRLEKLETENFDMSVRLAILEKEKSSWIDREKELQHTIEFLKKQLDDSYAILMKGNQ